jgi:monoamine oxidase
MKYDVIIVGAGAAGLMAMKELTEKGYSVCALEAAPAAGGRIATIHHDKWSYPIEGGAEFVHGDLPLTTRLLNEAGISFTKTEGEMIGVRNGVWHRNDVHESHWAQFTRQLIKTTEDVSIRSFLEKHFSAPEYSELRRAVKGFAEGFDLADIAKASVLAVKAEWQHQDGRQYRIDGGYGRLISHLERKGGSNNNIILFNTCVVRVKYRRDHVDVYAQNDTRYEASKIVLTVSAGVLQSGIIRFEPELPAYNHAIRQLGFGTVIKFLLCFRTQFWNDHHKSIGFLLSDEEIPTWWTQLPGENNLLTGWLGGPIAAARSVEEDDSLLAAALNSLSNIFRRSPGVLRNDLVFHQVICWQNNPYVRGGYSYDTVESASSKKLLSQPVNDTLYFAGEALYNGNMQGTVEAALHTGKAAADGILRAERRLV